MKLVVGLGNPGKELEQTRHNLGFMVIEALAKALNKENNNSIFKFNKKFKAEVCQLNLEKQKIILLKPQTFMNTSGQAVSKAASFYKIKPDDIYLIHDDLDMKTGEYKIQFAKGPKQHNGVLSVEKELGTKDFWRTRIGITKPETEQKNQPLSGSNYVLESFSSEEKTILTELIKVIVKKLKEKL